MEPHVTVSSSNVTGAERARESAPCRPGRKALLGAAQENAHLPHAHSGVKDTRREVGFIFFRKSDMCFFSCLSILQHKNV